jgi:hypothetical protein
MKIKLEANEIGAILKEWAKSKYKTHNINCDLLLGKTTVDAELEIIMPEQDIGNTQTNASMAELMAAQVGLPKAHLMQDLTPDFAGNTEGL